MKKLTSTAWAIIHEDGSLCRNLIRETRTQASKAQCGMFPHMTKNMFKQLGFKFRKVTISYRK